MDVRRLQIVGETTYICIKLDQVSELNICDIFNKQKKEVINQKPENLYVLPHESDTSICRSVLIKT